MIVDNVVVQRHDLTFAILVIVEDARPVDGDADLPQVCQGRGLDVDGAGCDRGVDRGFLYLVACIKLPASKRRGAVRS
ncbi:hypothetical protein [Marinovum algicola]|uniref:hypothetical protein n=1 Tax=Marinovum algicola TaxID=42444 RepID=UPI00352A782B